MQTLEMSESGAQPSVVLTKHGAVAFITLNRPDAYNAINSEVTRLLLAAISDIEKSAQTRVIVLRGAGKGFCAGGDLPFFAAQGDKLRTTVDQMLGDAGRFLQALRDTNKLVIASVHGTAAGAGLSLAVACDFCIAAANAVFVPAYTKLAVSPDMGGTANMVRAIGYRNAMRVFFLEDRLSAEQAERLGIVSRIVEPSALSEATLGLAQRLAQLPQAGCESTKALLRQASCTELSEQLAAELDSFQSCIQGPETQAALRRFGQKQPDIDSPSPSPSPSPREDITR
jgi:enoyl-CoA hydratase/carnithine racemase